MVKPYYTMISERGGMITCGDHLGVYVGTDIKATPNGWAFIALEDATPELVEKTAHEIKKGRKDWPEKEEQIVVKKTNQKKRKKHG